MNTDAAVLCVVVVLGCVLWLGGVYLELRDRRRL